MKPYTAAMEFWTFSGVNSWRETAQAYVDYVWEFLADRVDREPDRRYASRLGGTSHYDDEHNVVGLDSEKKLDAEAAALAESGGDYPAVERGAWNGLEVRVMLLGPKTTTQPPKPDTLEVEVYWSPRDQVPNQAPIRPDSLTYWRGFARGRGQVWPVENQVGEGMGRGHDYRGFMVPEPRIVTRVLRNTPGSRVRRYVWMETGEVAPNPIARIRDWLDDEDVDLVIVAHSQGTNIAMHFLQWGFA